jgi:hypothetical protein
MTDDLGRLEGELERLGRAVAYPSTPALAATVTRRLEAASRPAAAPTSRRWGLAGLAVAAALALALALGVWAPGREVVADFFERLRIFQTEESPTGLPRDIVGTPVSLTEAQGRLGFTPREATCPKGVELKRTLLQVFPGFRAVVLFYEHEVEPGFALFQTQGSLGKGLPFDAEAEPVAGLGNQAYWLEGLRIVEYYDEQGQTIVESRRATDANTLVWDEGGLLFRVEGDLTLELALCVARSLR